MGLAVLFWGGAWGEYRGRGGEGVVGEGVRGGFGGTSEGLRREYVFFNFN